jgi:hypothetical protein
MGPVRTAATYSSDLEMLSNVKTDCTLGAGTKIYAAGTYNVPTKTCAFIWWSSSVEDNDILDGGEVAVLTIVFKGGVNGDRPAELDKIVAEVVPAGASILTVERVVPTITTTVVNMN